MAATYPSYPNRTAHLLDGLWEFSWQGDVDPDALEVNKCVFDRRVSVPSCFDTLPDLAGKRGVAVYRSRVYCPKGRTGWLFIKGAGVYATIWADGEKVGAYQLPYSGVGFKIPVSEEDNREICIVVDNRFDEKRSPLIEPYYDFYAYGGIYRSVEWHILPETAVDRAFVTVVDAEKGKIKIKVVLHEPCRTSEEVMVRCDRSDWEQQYNMEEGDQEYEFDFEIKKPRVWSPERPSLHLLEVAVGVDRVAERFGLRTVEVKGQDILLNGQPLELRGVCRHEAHPDFGPALPTHVLIQDLERIKSLGCNFIRGTHYPQDQRFLDLCDEMGMLVFEESLGWGQQIKHFKDDQFCDLAEAQTSAMVRNSFNHPSIIMWGFLNEAESDARESDFLFSRLIGAIREMDMSRPITFATNRALKDRQLAKVDIISLNLYPGWYSENTTDARLVHEVAECFDEIEEHFKKENLDSKPVIISEIGAGAIYGWRDAHRAHWSEEYQRDLVLEAVREMEKRDWINGYTLWQYCDMRTYDNANALKRPRAFNNKGLCDEYRRPKLVWDALKEELSD
ncbi:MAG: glycoside hydrolase family 2 TIM barrel-domain containing protein [Verrucomicrobiota bacterium]